MLPGVLRERQVKRVKAAHEVQGRKLHFDDGDAQPGPSAQVLQAVLPCSCNWMAGAAQPAQRLPGPSPATDPIRQHAACRR
eukprot:9316059-Lingulodinium_polyedra.AAC.1